MTPLIVVALVLLALNAATVSAVSLPSSGNRAVTASANEERRSDLTSPPPDESANG